MGTHNLSILNLADLNGQAGKIGRVTSDEMGFEFVTPLLPTAPSSKYNITNLYVDPDTGRLVIEYDDTPIE